MQVRVRMNVLCWFETEHECDFVLNVRFLSGIEIRLIELENEIRSRITVVGGKRVIFHCTPKTCSIDGVRVHDIVNLCFQALEQVRDLIGFPDNRAAILRACRRPFRFLLDLNIRIRGRFAPIECKHQIHQRYFGRADRKRDWRLRRRGIREIREQGETRIHGNNREINLRRRESVHIGINAVQGEEERATLRRRCARAIQIELRGIRSLRKL